jgi:hypothetical protein
MPRVFFKISPAIFSSPPLVAGARMQERPVLGEHLACKSNSALHDIAFDDFIDKA